VQLFTNDEYREIDIERRPIEKSEEGSNGNQRKKNNMHKISRLSARSFAHIYILS
jgi:hypothetical protein